MLLWQSCEKKVEYMKLVLILFFNNVLSSNSIGSDITFNYK